LEKINKIDKPLARLKEKTTQIKSNMKRKPIQLIPQKCKGVLEIE
jgi:hypothetical protein